MKNKVILLYLILLIVPMGVSQSDEIEHCSIDSKLLTIKTIHNCAGKVVKISGKNSQMFLQHPSGLHDVLDSETDEVKRRYENHIGFDGHEIVVTTEKRIECTDNIEIEGIVDIVDLGGKEGTKGSYSNIWIKALNYKCH